MQLPHKNQGQGPLVVADKVLNFVKVNGPVIPNTVRKSLGGDITLISAVLSDLKSAGKVKVSDTKIGGSPTYYVSGQEPRLQALSKYLNEKDRQTFELIKEKRVLRDYSMSTLVRFSLRKIKDFAVPLFVMVGNEQEIFWKWYLLADSGAEEMIKEMLGLKKPEPIQAEPAKSHQVAPEPAKPDGTEPVRNLLEQMPKIAEKPAEKKLQHQDESLEAKSEPPEKKKEALPQQEKKKEKPAERKRELKPFDDTADGFLPQVMDFFSRKGIIVVEKSVLRKNADLEFTVKVPTAVGSVEYFCKAKNKRKCSEGDISSAYLRSQGKKLPLLFIASGDVAKNIRERLGTDFKGMVLSRISD